MSDVLPQGTGCLIAIYLALAAAVVAGVSFGVAYLIWGGG